jgi:hypothetical protein
MTIQIIAFIIVLAIVVYFLRKENKKEKQYFGEKVAPNRKEKKILEKNKQEYEPVKPDNRLATMENHHWELEDIAKSATEIIYDSPLPTKSQTRNLKTGDLVKLTFVIDEDGETEVERMWVKVTGKKDGLFCGELDNDPFNEILKAGQLIWFHPNHVLEIDNPIA